MRIPHPLPDQTKARLMFFGKRAIDARLENPVAAAATPEYTELQQFEQKVREVLGVSDVRRRA
jgi:hypothetical protein